MSYSYSLSDEAEDDMFEAYVWYERQRPGLGEEFFDSLDSAEQSITLSPAAYEIRDKKKRVRGFPLHRFPYLILYTLKENDINVISVFHTDRDPKIWKNRVK